jgi:hypothetical protein
MGGNGNGSNGTAADRLRGLRVVDRRGEPVGTIVGVQLDANGRDPRWARIKPAGGGTHAIVAPLAGAAIVADDVELAIELGELGAR